MIREATIEDKGAVENLFLEELVFHLCFVKNFFNQQTIDSILPKEYYENILESEKEMILVSEVGDTVVGLIMFTINSTDDDLFLHQKWIHVNELIVCENYRGKGIGKKLLMKVEDYAWENDMNHIRLHVWRDNENAIKFYEHHDFKSEKMIMFKTHVAE